MKQHNQVSQQLYRQPFLLDHQHRPHRFHAIRPVSDVELLLGRLALGLPKHWDSAALRHQHFFHLEAGPLQRILQEEDLRQQRGLTSRTRQKVQGLINQDMQAVKKGGPSG